MAFLRFFTLATLLLLITPAQTGAAPLSTNYFSLDTPADWVIVQGPKKEKGAVHVLLGQKDHKCSTTLTVGPCVPGDAEKAAQNGSKTLGGTPPAARNGQIEFTFDKNGVKGHVIVREDTQAKLLLVLIIAGDAKQADFVYAMRSPYKNLVPRRP
ncbi:MAG: hypothetical protein LBB60_06635 [Desulfovibrio sp.]|jgi:hypothetical protein|nr:hypothetical protein [Desulfovibrio sp.]